MCLKGYFNHQRNPYPPTYVALTVDHYMQMFSVVIHITCIQSSVLAAYGSPLPHIPELHRIKQDWRERHLRLFIFSGYWLPFKDKTSSVVLFPVFFCNTPLCHSGLLSAKCKLWINCVHASVQLPGEEPTVSGRGGAQSPVLKDTSTKSFMSRPKSLVMTHYAEMGSVQLVFLCVRGWLVSKAVA